jgi:hypothetical protein
MAGEQLAGTPPQQAVEGGPKDASAPRDANVARLDEIRASVAKDQQTGDAASAG